MLVWLKVSAATLFEEGTGKLVPRYDKYLHLRGDCVEKQFDLDTNILQLRYSFLII